MTDEIKRLGEQILGHKPDSQEWQIALRAYELGARPTREFPQQDDEFFWLDDEGNAHRGVWQRAPGTPRNAIEIDNARLRQGNVFASQEAAQREARRREVKAWIAAIDAMYTAQKESEPYYFLKFGGGWDFSRGVPEAKFAGVVLVNSHEAAESVLAEIPAEDLELLCAEPEFVPPKEG